MAIGAKSLSHVLSCIERCKDRLLSIGTQSEIARLQIIQAVVSYWADLPGVAVNIVDKLLNYTIVTPESVVRWCLGSTAGTAGLAESWRYEMLASTMGKVTNRVRQIVGARVQATKASLPDDQMAVLDGTLSTERQGMRALFALIVDLLVPYTADADEHIRRWADRWTRVFKRKAAVEETIVGEDAVKATLERSAVEWEREERKRVEVEMVKEEKRVKKEREEEEERTRVAKEREDKEMKERERDRAIMEGDGDGQAGAEFDVADVE